MNTFRINGMLYCCRFSSSRPALAVDDSRHCLLQDCIVRSTIAYNINKEVMLASSNELVVVGNHCVYCYSTENPLDHRLRQKIRVKPDRA